MAPSLATSKHELIYDMIHSGELSNLPIHLMTGSRGSYGINKVFGELSHRTLNNVFHERASHTSGRATPSNIDNSN